MKANSLSVLWGILVLLSISCTTAQDSTSNPVDSTSNPVDSTTYETTETSTSEVSTAVDRLSSTEATGTTSEVSNENVFFSTWAIVGAVLIAVLFICLVFVIYKIKNRNAYVVQRYPRS